MKLITLEEHMTTERFLASTEPKHKPQGAIAAFLQTMNARLLNIADERIAAMDKAGIDVQVLSLAGAGLNELDAALGIDLATEANDRMARAISAHPTRFSAFAALPAQAPEKAAVLLKTYVERHGFKGAMIDGTVSGKFLDHPDFLPIFETAQALDVPIYLHPAPPPSPVEQAYFGDLKGAARVLLAGAAWGWHAEAGLHALRLMTSGLFDRLPKLKIILGHFGENLPSFIARSNSKLAMAGLPLQRSILDYFVEHFWITSSGMFTIPPMLCAREVVRPDHLMLSIDYPFSPMEQGRNFAEDLSSVLTEAEMEAVTFGNAAALLRL